MKKIWLIAKTVYQKQIRSTTFLLLTLGLPLLMIAGGLFGYLRASGGDFPVTGVVDQTQQLAPVEKVSLEDETLVLQPFETEEAAREALRSGQIGGYLVIPKGYFAEESATFYGEEAPNAFLEQALTQFMRQALAADAPAWALERLEDPSDITYLSHTTGESVSEGPAVVFRVAAPLVLAILFLFAVFTGASQLGTAVVEEKDSRVMEMVITSLAPRQLVTGKVLGMSLLSLTQIAVWVGGALIALVLLLSGEQALRSLVVPWEALLWAVLLGIPGYFLYAVVAAGLGVLAGDKQQARQMAGMLGFIGMAPMYFMGALINAMDSTLAVTLSLFPFTAPTISLIRMSMTEVPFWQLGGSFLILLLTTLVGIWFLTKIFRAAMLMYGQALRPQQIVQALRD